METWCSPLTCRTQSGVLDATEAPSRELEGSALLCRGVRGPRRHHCRRCRDQTQAIRSPRLVSCFVLNTFLPDSCKISFSFLKHTSTRTIVNVSKCFTTNSVLVQVRFPLHSHKLIAIVCSCWLSTQDGVIYAFVGPALTIIAVNHAYTTHFVRSQVSPKQTGRISKKPAVNNFVCENKKDITHLGSFKQACEHIPFIRDTI